MQLTEDGFLPQDICRTPLYKSYPSIRVTEFSPNLPCQGLQSSNILICYSPIQGAGHCVGDPRLSPSPFLHTGTTAETHWLCPQAVWTPAILATLGLEVYLFPYPMITSPPCIFNISCAGFPSATLGDTHCSYVDPATKPRSLRSTLNNYVAIKHSIIISCRASNQTKTLVEYSHQLHSH